MIRYRNGQNLTETVYIILLIISPKPDIKEFEDITMIDVLTVFYWRIMINGT